MGLVYRFVIFFGLLCILQCDYVSAATPRNNVRGGHMNDTDLWENYGDPTIEIISVENLEYMKITSPRGAGIQKRRLELESGETYELSFDAKVESGYLLPKASIKGTINGNVYRKNADFEEGGNNKIYPHNTVNWKGINRQFTLPQGFDSRIHRFSLRFIQYYGSSNIDNISLIKSSTENLIKVDPHMEALSSRLVTHWGNPIVSKDSDVSFDSHVLKVMTPENIDSENGNAKKSKAGIQYKDVSVQAGHTYELSFDVKIEHGKVWPKLVITGNPSMKQSDFEDNTIRLYAYNHTTPKRYIRRFTVPANFNTSLILRLIVENEKIAENSYNNGSALFDNISIIEVDPLNIIPDGNMEAISAKTWLYWGNGEGIAAVEKSDTSKHSGDYSLRIRTTDNEGNNIGGIQQTQLSIDPNKRYQFSFWYNIPQGVVIPRLGIGDSNEDFEFLFGSGDIPVLFSTNGEWHYYSREFQSSEEKLNSDLRVVFALYDLYRDNENLSEWDYAELYLDEVSIVELAEEVSLDSYSYAAIGASFTTAFGCSEFQPNINCEKGYTENFTYNPDSLRFTQLLLGSIKERYQIENNDNLNEHNYASNGSPVNMMLAQARTAARSNHNLITIWAEGNDTITYVNSASDANHVLEQAAIDNIPLDSFEYYLTEILNEAVSIQSDNGNNALILVGNVPDFERLPCAGTGGCYGVWGTDEVTLSNIVAQALNAKISEVVETFGESNIQIVDFYNYDLLYNPENYIAGDGLHFSITGHQVVADRWLEYLE